MAATDPAAVRDAMPGVPAMLPASWRTASVSAGECSLPRRKTGVHARNDKQGNLETMLRIPPLLLPYLP